MVFVHLVFTRVPCENYRRWFTVVVFGWRLSGVNYLPCLWILLFLFWSVSIIIGTERSWSLDFFHRKSRTHIFCRCALNWSLLRVHSVPRARKRGPTLLLVTTQKCVWSFSPKHHVRIRFSKSRLAGWVLLYVHRNRRLIRDGNLDGHLDLHTAPELWKVAIFFPDRLLCFCHNQSGWRLFFCQHLRLSSRWNFSWQTLHNCKPTRDVICLPIIILQFVI